MPALILFAAESTSIIMSFLICRYCFSLAVEGYLAKNKEGSYGVTGEGSLLDNAAGKLHLLHFVVSTLLQRNIFGNPNISL